MSATEIFKVHLSLIRTFSYYKRDVSEETPFGFLVDDKEYYETVMEKEKRLWERGVTVPGLGRLRSVLDPPDPKIPTDPFFSRLPEYYGGRGDRRGLWGSLRSSILGEPEMVRLTHHFPCAVDSIPSRLCKYRVITSSLPGSLSAAVEAKMSLGMRVYPVGLASLRLGWFFSTFEGFRVGDVIDFLSRKSSSVEISKGSSGSQTLRLDELCKEYAMRLIRGLHGELRALPNWELTHSIVDIVESDPLTFEEDYRDTLLPLLCLDKSPSGGDRTAQNLARGGDEMLLAGPSSFVVHMPSASYPDLRKVRRWLRNVTELYSIQDYLVGEVERIRNSIDYGQLRDRHWMGRIRKGVLPPTIRDLYSAYNYLNLHMRPAPMREEWADRYQKILRVMDRRDRIRGARDEAGRLLKTVVEESEKASREVGELLRTLFDMVLKGAKALG